MQFMAMTGQNEIQVKISYPAIYRLILNFLCLQALIVNELGLKDNKVRINLGEIFLTKIGF